MKKALLIIDLQNDYFERGKFPLWNTGKIMENIIELIKKARMDNIPIIHIQHIADPNAGIAPFFNEGTEGAEIRPEILKASPDGETVIKHYADSFYKTNLEEVLTRLEVDELLICGMMTQNCVTHTAISKSAEKYKVKIIADCCTTVNEPIHLIALNAVSTRIELINLEDVL